jgi:hypothetical protein
VCRLADYSYPPRNKKIQRACCRRGDINVVSIDVLRITTKTNAMGIVDGICLPPYASTKSPGVALPFVAERRPLP